MTGQKREQLEAEWIERLWRFQKRPGNAAEFCRAEGVSLAILYRWRQRLAETVPGLVPGPGVSGPAHSGSPRRGTGRRCDGPRSPPRP
jgi:transposase-like protein